ncbi:MAG: transglutaminase domain-containing protein [Deltaproteobacteria bacterium]|nr:transglutaminase domain-containing protein [Deltaproteobacteria bacterium]
MRHIRRRALALLAFGLALPACRCGSRPASDTALLPAEDATATEATVAPDAGGTPGTLDTVPRADAEAWPGGALVPPEALADFVARGTVDAWYGVYLTGRKVGWAHVELGRAAPDEPGGFVARLELRIVQEGLLPGLRSESIVRAEDFYAVEPPFALVESRDVQQTPAGTVERVTVATAAGLVMRQTVQGQAAPERSLPPTAETALAAVGAFGLDAARLRPGMTMVVPAFDDDDACDETDTVTVVSVEPQLLAGVQTPVATLTVLHEDDNQPFVLRVAGNTTLEASMGTGIVLRLEDQEQARSDLSALGPLDLRVEIDRPLGSPTDVRELRLVVGVPSGFAIPSGPQQEITPRDDGRFDVVLRAVPGPKATNDERERSLRPTPEVDADAPSIVKLAEELAADAATDRDKADRIVAWVYDNLRKDLSTNLGTASQVLDRKVGDCTEHALLVTALARAAGLPARQVSGLIYVGDELGFFGWHAWTQITIDGRWVAVDASWNEPTADAAHLLLGIGDSTDWLTIIDSITISAPPPQDPR